MTVARLSPVLAASISACLAFSLSAQEPQPPAGGGMPTPITEHHQAFKTLAGSWRVTSTMAAMPGVEGMEEPSKTTSVERAELICNGLWLKVTGSGEWNGQQMSGIWMLGHNPHNNRYQGVSASSMAGSLSTFEGTYDPERQRWSFEVKTAMGEFRSELVMDGSNRAVETIYGKGPDGAEQVMMTMERVRMKDDAASRPAASQPTGSPRKVSRITDPATQMLASERGRWTADWKMAMPGMPAMTADCVETVEAVCGGAWNWSTFRGPLLGGPFEGHALTGVDPGTGRVTSFWVDSWTAPYMRTEGTFDRETNVFTLTGQAYNGEGKLDPVKSIGTTVDKDSRTLEMHFGKGDGKSVMTIRYRRKR